MQQMLVPMPWRGTTDQISWTELQWLQSLGEQAYCALWQRWPKDDLPTGYKLYIVSFHLEAVDINWVERQSELYDANIVVLSDSNFYNWTPPANVYCYTYYWWHEQVKLINQWFPSQKHKNLQYKFSTICNRITQSKLLIFTAIMNHAKQYSLVKLSDWVDPNDGRLPTNNVFLDGLMDQFYSQWGGKTISIDEFNQQTDNHHRYTADPWTPVYQQCALHFTNESFHYSLMMDHRGSYNYPGPFITEKTLKCLVGATGFIPVGQYDTFGALTNVGFKFDYGFSTAFDSDAGNITRLETLCHLVEDLATYSIDDLYQATEHSSKHNQKHITSGEFDYVCQTHNSSITSQVLDKFL